LVLSDARGSVGETAHAFAQRVLDVPRASRTSCRRGKASLVTSVLTTISREPVVTTILARAEGNPFFLEELARAVGEQPGPSRLHVPDTVHDVLATRIARLAEADRGILRRAAVIGRDVPLALLEDVCDVASEELASASGRLQSAEFVYPTRLGPEPEYTFKQLLRRIRPDVHGLGDGGQRSPERHRHDA
jgi:hypothetical protein